MNRCLLLSAVLFAVGALVAEQAFSAVNPPGNERRSMGNLKNTERPNPNSGGGSTLHRPWSYGNPPYYRRPPTTPYYVVPQPVYPTPYYGYPSYRYPSYRYRSYPMTPHPWGPTIHYPTPYWSY